MTTIRIPTPLRTYTDGEQAIQVRAETVAEAMDSLVQRYPTLRKHLYDELGNLRSYVNLFVNEKDVRSLQGSRTRLDRGDQLKIIPSIAGGSAETDRPTIVDHSGLNVNQAAIITLSLAAFVLDIPLLVALTAGVMLIAPLVGKPGFTPLYAALRRLGLVKPNRLIDHPQPHRFSQTLGGIFLAVGWLALSFAQALIGWALVWIVIGLAALNLFAGFCVGCAMYYWLTRLGVPGFSRRPPEGTSPGWRATQRPES